jgi:hypothetical protein
MSRIIISWSFVRLENGFRSGKYLFRVYDIASHKLVEVV